MNPIIKTTISILLGVGFYASAQAAAEYRPDYCAVDHDHRSHSSNYYDHYKKDKYYRAGDYRRSNDSYDRRGRYDRDRRYDRRGRSDRRYDRYRPRSRVVHRETYDTKYRAHIVLVEEIYWTRSGREQLVCSVLVKGPEAYYVKNRRLRRIARRDCSRHARIQYL